MSSRRSCLDGASSSTGTHAGLWLDKYFRDIDSSDGEQAKQTLVKEVAAIACPDAYGRFYSRWVSELENMGAETREAKTQGRLSVGLGNDAVLESSVTLHHTYGVPYLPGSALKGLAANYARNRLNEAWQQGSEAYRTLFGDTEKAGYVQFLDALYIPGSAKGDRALHPDVITVHHPKYYQGEEPPADWDSPTPIPFLSANGRYLLALTGPQAWVEAALAILESALEELGIGAKTSSGYGRMAIAEPPPDPERAEIDRMMEILDGMPNSKVAPEINRVYRQWQELDISPANKKVLAQAILDKIDAAITNKKKKARMSEKPWFQELQEFVSEGDGS